jgi:hypothetical protein
MVKNVGYWWKHLKRYATLKVENLKVAKPKK